ncbi:TPA: hypothetical protein ACGVAV_002989 [Vibrio vulnificus]
MFIKKRVLVVALILEVVTLTSANATRTDGQWSDSLHFSGTITNNNPVWQFKIAEEVQRTYGDIIFNPADITDDGKTKYLSLHPASGTKLFVGVMKVPSTMAVHHLRPNITIKTRDGEIEPLEKHEAVTTNLNVNGSSIVYLAVTIKTHQAVTAIKAQLETKANIPRVSLCSGTHVRTQGTNDLFYLIDGVPGAVHTTECSDINEVPSPLDDFTMHGYTRVTGAIAMIITSANLVQYSTTDFPKSWSAIMPMTITMP